MQTEFIINYWAILVSAVINFVIGFLIYAFIFSKKWSEWTGIKYDPETSPNPAPLYLKNIIATMLTYFVLAHFILVWEANTISSGANTAFWCWLGFIMPVQFTASLFSGKTKKLFFLDTSYQLITMLIAGGILAVWK